MRMGHHRELNDYLIQDCGLCDVFEELHELKMLVEDCDASDYRGDYDDYLKDIQMQVQSLEIALFESIRNNSHLEKLIKKRVESGE